jgi:hypothetical protein
MESIRVLNLGACTEFDDEAEAEIGGDSSYTRIEHIIDINYISTYGDTAGSW